MVKLDNWSTPGNIPSSANLVTQPVSPVSPVMREKLAEGIDETHGINESMRGKQNRETSGFAMQYAADSRLALLRSHSFPFIPDAVWGTVASVEEDLDNG